MKKMIFTLLLFSTGAYAQKSKCLIYGTAYKDCSTGIIQLNAFGGFSTYSWSPASPLSNPNIPNPTTTTSGTYTVTGTLLGAEQVVNPDFSAGNTGFTSGMNYSSVYTPGNYFVGGGWFAAPINPAFPDHTSTADNMFMSIDGAAPAAIIWEETMSIAAASNYTFSFWASQADQVVPQFEIHFIGNITGDVIVGTQSGILYNPMNGWQWDQYGIPMWSSGANTSVTVRIINTETAGGGNDFALDDFSFRRIVCTASYAVNATTNLGMDLLTNGDLSAGNVGFMSSHAYMPLYAPCNYYVGPGWFSSTFNPSYPDHTPSSDNMFMSFDGCNPASVLWEQTVAVTNNTVYNFEFWATEADYTQPIFEIHFIGDVTGDVIVATQAGIPYSPMTGWRWDSYGVPCWRSNADNTVTIRIINLQTASSGNDFGMDDFSFRECCDADQCCSHIPDGRLAGNANNDQLVTLVDIFPNPSNGSFQIQFSAPVLGAQVELVNMMGERLETFVVNETTYQYDPKQKLAAGVYLVRITNNGKQEVKRIIVE
jgi:hypothetical protein